MALDIDPHLGVKLVWAYPSCVSSSSLLSTKQACARCSDASGPMSCSAVRLPLPSVTADARSAPRPWCAASPASVCAEAVCCESLSGGSSARGDLSSACAAGPGYDSTS